MNKYNKIHTNETLYSTLNCTP